MNIKQQKIKHSYAKISRKPLKPPTPELRPPQIHHIQFQTVITVWLMSLLEGAAPLDSMQTFY